VLSNDSLKGIAARAASIMSIAAACIGLAGLAQGTGLGRVDVGAQAPQFTAKGADGKQHSLRDYAGKLVVLEWTNPVCPFTAVKYKSGTMQALQRYAASRQIVWLSIDTAAPDKAGYLTPPAARARIAQTHATVTAFLFDVAAMAPRPRRAFSWSIATASLHMKAPWTIKFSRTTLRDTNT
jgi:hypothetical protein